MGQLTFEQNLLLSTLIYFEDIVNNPNGDSIEKIIKGIQGKGGLDQYKVNNQLPAMMNEDEWNDCFNKILADPELKNLKLANPSNDSKNFPSDFRAACFVSDPVDNPRDVNIIFRGTSADAVQWTDNVEGAFFEDTLYQELALKYVDTLPYSGNQNYSVAGHSKGGNLATYVTVHSDKIKQCHAFDSQGFSEDFIKENKLLIEKNNKKITAINAQKDPVSLLLTSIAGSTFLFKTEEMENPALYHKPSALFGKINPDNTCVRTPEYKIAKVLLDEIIKDIDKFPKPVKELLSKICGDLITGNASPGDIIALLVAMNFNPSGLNWITPTGVSPEFLGIVRKLIGAVVLITSTDSEFLKDYNRYIRRNILFLEIYRYPFNQKDFLLAANTFLNVIFGKSKKKENFYKEGIGNQINVDIGKLLLISDELLKVQNRINRVNWNLQEVNRNEKKLILTKGSRNSPKSLYLVEDSRVEKMAYHLKNTVSILDQCERKNINKSNEF